MEPDLKNRSSRIMLIYVFIHLMLYVIQRLCLIPLRQMEDVNRGLVSILLSTLPLYLIGLPAAVFLFGKLSSFTDNTEKQDFDSFRLMNYFFVCYSFLFAGGLLSSWLKNFLSKALGKTVSDPASLLIISDVPGWLLILATVIIAPIGEEFLFRYLPYKKLCGFGILPYMLISSFCFSLFHMNFFQGIYTFPAALVFSYVYAKSGKLRFPIILHMMINLMGSVLAPLFSKSMEASLYFTSLILLISIVGILEFFVFAHRKAFDEIKDGFESFRINWLLNSGGIVFAVIFLISSVKSLK